MEAFRRAMTALDVEGRLIATDVTSASAAYVKADLGVPSPPVGSIQYISTLHEIVRKNQIGLLVPLTDLDLRQLARHRDAFAAEGCTVMIGSEQSIMLCRDKAQTNALLAKIGLSSIITRPLAEFMKAPFYPCFIKPLRGSAGIGAAVIHDEQELKSHVATHGQKMIVQEYAPGQEFTIDVYRTRAGEVKCVVPRQRLAVRSGEVEKGVTVRDKELTAAAMKLAANLEGLWGVFCCQCRREANGATRFFEVNPRFGGGCLLSIAAGADLPMYLMQEVLGLPITAEIGKFTDRLLMLRYDEAVFVRVEDRSKLPGFDTPTFR